MAKKKPATPKYDAFKHPGKRGKRDGSGKRGKRDGSGESGKRDGSGKRSGTGPILLSQATFVLAHIANSGPVPLSLSAPTR